MFFVIVGVIVIALNLLDIGPPAAWNWDFTGDVWKFTVPFILAALWWVWADKSGLNKRREMDKMDARKEKRRRENLENMGLNVRSVDKKKRQASDVQTAREREVEKVEGKRTKQREKNRDSILGSRFDSQSTDPEAAPRDDAKR
jgi:small Trp-rich protein